MLQKHVQKTTKEINEIFIIKIKSELFVWINAKCFCEDKRDGAFSTPPVSFHSTLPPHPALCVSLFHIQPIIGARDGSLMCSQHAPLHAHVNAAE